MAIEYLIKEAVSSDIEDIFHLSNDSLVRKNSRNTDMILWKDHVEWFYSRINSPDPYYVVRGRSGQLIAQARIDCGDKNIISISISSEYRGKGLGAPIIKACTKRSGFNEVYAYIKNGNIASQKAFLKAGYNFISEDSEYGIYKFVNNSVYVIAEMSANHCGNKSLAKDIIVAAKEAGADAIKVQTYKPDTMTIDCKSDVFAIKGGTLWDNRYFYDLYKEAFTPWEWQTELKDYADSLGIDFFSTPFDTTAVDFLETIRVRKYKIASFEAVDYNFVKYVASRQKPMIISTGISSFDEIQDVLNACKSVGNNDITLLKCTSAYPAKLEDMNLNTITDMYEKFGVQGAKIGLSDHTLGIEAPVIAVTLGATVIEKHFTLDRSLGGADAAFSLNVDEFSSMVKSIRNTEKLLGKVDYSVNSDNRKFARSLFIVKDIHQGETLTKENVRSIRPGYGMHPKYYNFVLGKKASKFLERGKPLEQGDYY